jgi:hypothetical protein
MQESEANTVPNTPEATPFQNSQTAIDIPSEYIFYEWAYFILSILGIIENLIILIVLVKKG